ncbi:MAG: NAD-dependent epimerase/dehydratase family protein [Acidimicrobiia bacterium]|nr:NAD-dependent epimerase/dehydratase family protein [Acidimicrobiia bacterium]
MTADGTFVVTGAAGFVGSRLTAALLRAGHRVLAVDACTGPNLRVVQRARVAELSNRGARFTELDLRRVGTDDLAGLIPRGSVVVHLAALPGVRPSWGELRPGYLESNVAITRTVTAAARRAGARRLVYASSSSVYGNAPGLMSEATRTCPVSPYGRTKLGGELLVRHAATRGDLDTVVVRYFTVYGPGQRPDMAIARFVDAIHRGAPVRVFGSGRQRRDFTFVDDAVAGTLAAATRGRIGGVYNLGHGQPTRLIDVLRRLEQMTGRRLHVVHEEPAAGDPPGTHADVTRAARELGWSARVSLDDGLDRQVAAQFALNTQRRETA